MSRRPMIACSDRRPMLPVVHWMTRSGRSAGVVVMQVCIRACHARTLRRPPMARSSGDLDTGTASGAGRRRTARRACHRRGAASGARQQAGTDDVPESRLRAGEVTTCELAELLSPSLFADERVVVLEAAADAGKDPSA